MKRILLLFLATAGIAVAQTDVIDRYESILVRNPSPGAAFDKIYEHHLEAGSLDALREKWRGLAEADSEDAPRYLLLLGFLESRMGSVDGALDAIQRYVEVRPDDPAGWLALAGIEKNRNRLEEATTALGSALEKIQDPEERLAASRERALLLERQFRTDEAVEAWKRIAAESAGDAATIEDAAEALSLAGEFGAAEQLLTELRDDGGLDPARRVQVGMSLARLKERQGNAAEALSGYDALLESVSDSSWLRRDLRARIETLFRSREDLPGLAEYYTKRIEAHPQDYEAALRLAEVYAELERKDESIVWTRKAAELAPDNEVVQIDAAERLIQAGEPAEAVGIVERLLRDKPQRADLQELLGDAQWAVWEATGDETRKAAAIEAWRQLVPDPPTTGRLMRLAEIFEGQELQEEAIAEYRRVLELEPAAADARARLSLLLVARGDNEEAWRVMDGMVPDSGATAADYVRLARLQEEVERADAALATVRAGVAKFPTPELLELEYRLLDDRGDKDAALAVLERLLETDAARLDEHEARMAALLSALERNAAVTAELRGRLNDGTASEADVRMLIRLMHLAGEEAELDEVMTRAFDQFPDSVSLLRLRLAVAGRRGDSEGILAAAGRLAEIDAAGRADWLRQIASEQVLQNKREDALDTARRVIQTSPAAVDGYLFAAEIARNCGDDEMAIRWLREASQLGDDPREALVQLSQALMAAGRTQEAIDTMERAFDLEKDPAGKLNLVGQLTELYLQAGRVDELIQRYEQRQSAEGAEGWRYAMYLSEIHVRMQDFVSAREQLSRALAARPKDAALLRQLIRLTMREGNPQERVRYERQLATMENSAAADLSLAEALLAAAQPEEAWTLIEKRRNEWIENPGLIAEATVQMVQSGFGDRFRESIDAALKEDATNWELRLRKVEAMVGNTDLAAAAQEALAIFREAQADPATATPASPQSLAGFFGMSRAPRWQGRAQERAMRMMMANSVAGMMLVQATQPGTINFSGGSMSSRVRALAVRDFALALYFQLLLSESDIETAHEATRKALEEAGAGELEILAAFTAMQPIFRNSTEPLPLTRTEREVIQRRAESTTEDPGADVLALSRLGVAQPEDDSDRKLMRKFLDRVGDGGSQGVAGYQAAASALQALGDFDDAAGVIRKWSAEFDPSSISEFYPIFQNALKQPLPGGLLDGILARVEESSNSAMNSVSIPFYYALSALETSSGREVTFADRLEIAESLLKHLSRGSSSGSRGRRSQNLLQTGTGSPFVSTRFLGDQDALAVQQFLSQIRGTGETNEFFDMLDRVVRDLPENRRAPALYIRALALWQVDDRKKAIEAMRELAASTQDGGVAVSLARMLMAEKDPGAAADLLAGVKRTRDGSYELAQLTLIEAAHQAERTELAREAAERLAGLRLSPNDSRTLAGVLQRFELNDLAEKVNNRTPRMSSGRNSFSEALGKINSMAAAGKKDEAKSALRAVFGRDVLTDLQPGEGDYRARQVFEAAGKIGILEELIEEWDRQIASSPDSQRLLLLQARAAKYRKDVTGISHNQKGWPMPVWVKLKREGTTVRGFFSRDGSTWEEFKQVELPLESGAFFGLAVSSRNVTKATTAKFEEVSWTGKGGTSDDWKWEDIGPAKIEGRAAFSGDAVEIVAAGREIQTQPTDQFFFCYRWLEGDGEITAKVTGIERTHEWAKAGVMVRQSLDPGAAFAVAAVTPAARAAFEWRPVPDRSFASWKRLAELRPGDPKYRVAYAASLMERGQRDEALEIFRDVLNKSPEFATKRPNDLIQTFAQADAMDELVEAAVGIPLNRFSQRPYELANFLDQLSGNLRDREQIDAAIALTRRRLEVLANHSPSDPLIDLINLLVETNREEEAKKELRSAMMPEERKRTASSAWGTPLGRLNNNSTGFGYRSVPSGAAIIGLAKRLGIEEELAAELKEGPRDVAENPMTYAMRIAAGDLTAIDEAGKSLNDGGQNAATLILCVLERVPNGAKRALDLLDKVVKPGSFPQQGGYRSHLLVWQLDFARQLGDRSAVEATEQKLLDSLESEMLPSGGGIYYYHQLALHGAIAHFVDTGDVEHAEKVIHLYEAAVASRGGSDSRVEAARKRLGLLKGEQTPVLIAWWKLDGKKHRLAWEFSVQGDGMRGLPTKAADGRYDIEVAAGADAGSVQPVRTVKKASSLDAISLDLPADAKAVRLRLVKNGEEISEPVFLAVPGSGNLLPNADFNVDRKSGVPGGWESPEGRWDVRDDSRAPGGRVARWMPDWDLVFGSRRASITSAPILLEPGRAYRFHGWCRLGQNSGGITVQVEGFDADGKRIFSETSGSRPSTLGEWQPLAVEVSAKKVGQNAKSARIVISSNTEFEISGASFCEQ